MPWRPGQFALPATTTAAIIPRMPVELIRPEGLYTGAPYAYAAIAGPGRLIFTAGACPIDGNGDVLGDGDYQRQARHAVANLVTALAAAGATLTDVVKTTIYVASADRGDLYDVWQVVRSAFGEHDAPGTLLGVTVLGWEGQLVEIEAVAMAPGTS